MYAALPEGIDYIRNNPVARGLVAQTGDWLWSSWRFHYLEDRFIVQMNRLL
jgi:hypothetical protein